MHVSRSARAMDCFLGTQLEEGLNGVNLQEGLNVVMAFTANG